MKLKIDCKYADCSTASWVMDADFQRVPCVGEMVSVIRNIGGSRVDGEPIESAVEFVFWDIADGRAEAVVYLEEARIASACEKHDRWMEDQGWVADI